MRTTRDDEYLNCDEYKNHTPDSEGFCRFQSTSTNLFYFSLSDDEGLIFRSEGYNAEVGRDNGIESVKRNMVEETRYNIVQLENGKWACSLKAANHQEIALSCPYDTEEEAKGIVPSERANKKAAKLAAAAAAIPSDNKIEDDYLRCGDYENKSRSSENTDFSVFTADNGQHYFALLDKNDNVFLRSEGYASTAARDNGIQSVIKNKEDKSRYSIVEKMGYFFLTLKAGNHQEIARSCAFKSAEEADAALNPPIEMAAADPIKNKIDDDYLKCADYEHKGGSAVYPDFSLFESNGQHYFALLDSNNKVFLRSEGYASTAARINGIQSVIKNKEDKSRFSIIEKSGHFFIVLKAGNHQEIARSCGYKTEAEANAALEPPVAEIMPPVEEIPATSIAPIIVVDTVIEEQKEKEDDYLMCKEYEGQAINDKINNVAMFRHSNGQFYFTIYNEDRSVRWRSEGFGSAKERDEELSGALKNQSNSDMVKIIEKGGYKINVLYDKSGREVGRSCAYKDSPVAVAEPVVEVVAPIVNPVVAAAPVIAAVAATVTAAAPEAPKEKEDDYLPCKEYEGQVINDKMNNVALFKHSNGQFYFAVYNTDGSVRWRSEGFSSPRMRDEELSGVIKNQGNNDMIKTIEKGGYKINVLYDKIGREVGRSCAYKDSPIVKAEPVVEAAPVIAAVAAASAITVEAPKEKEDDYLVCKEYEGQAITDKSNNVALFKHNNGQYYFTIYNNDGSVRWRSEGFSSTTDRDYELAEVLKNQNDKSLIKILEKGGYKIKVLFDKTGREVARSCAYKDAPPVQIVETVAAVAAAAAVTEIPKTTAPIVEVPKAAPVVIPEPEPAGWFKWWYLLALLPLLWLLWKGCSKTKPAVETPEMSVETPKAETPAVANTPAAEPCNIEWIYFDFDKSDIRTDASSTLDKVIGLLSKNPAWTVDLSGHTDIKGNATYNKALSARRYKSATAYLTAKSIDAKRIATTNARNTDYIGNNDEPDLQRQYNRRVEITLKDKDGKVVCEAVKPSVSK